MTITNIYLYSLKKGVLDTCCLEGNRHLDQHIVDDSSLALETSIQKTYKEIQNAVCVVSDQQPQPLPQMFLSFLSIPKKILQLAETHHQFTLIYGILHLLN